MDGNIPIKITINQILIIYDSVMPYDISHIYIYIYLYLFIYGLYHLEIMVNYHIYIIYII